MQRTMEPVAEKILDQDEQKNLDDRGELHRPKTMSVGFHRFHQTDQKKQLDQIFRKSVPERAGNKHHQVNRRIIASLQPVSTIGQQPLQRSNDQADDHRNEG